MVLLDRDVGDAVRYTADLPEAAKELVVHEEVTVNRRCKENNGLRFRKAISSYGGHIPRPRMMCTQTHSIETP